MPQIFLVFLVAILNLLNCDPALAFNTVKFYDGDNITIMHNGIKAQVRLACIDAPELKQAKGQVARKAFLMFSAQVEIYLNVVETAPSSTSDQIQFQLEKGQFHDFSADLTLQDYQSGTLLIYAVQATPTIPVPTMLLQEAMRLDLPANMRQMRRVISSSLRVKEACTEATQ